MKSILQDKKECYLCRLEAQRRGYHGEFPADGLHDHHIFFGTANRAISEQCGLKVWLCYRHHEGNDGPHLRRSVDLSLKGIAQREFEKTRSREYFRELFGKSWLDD